jgi:hypothetical protein
MINCIEGVFNTPLFYRDKINPPKEHKKKILSIFSDLTKKSPIMEDSEKLYYAVESSENFSTRKEFHWVNKQVNINSKIYLNDLGVDTNKTKLIVTNSYPTICYNRGGKINLTKNRDSHLTAFYCLKSDQDDEQGKLVLHSDNNIIKNVSYNFEDDNSKYLSFLASKCRMKFFTGRLIMFPSSIGYEFLPYFGKKHRFLITFEMKFQVEEIYQ